MSKFKDEFCETYGDTTKLKRMTKKLKEKNAFNKEMKQADMNLTKITKGKLGRTA